jgi:glutamate/tyrosine decarboxylase-like PLP-dependent enzyme
VTAPAEAVVEEVCGDWAKQLLGIPPSASFAFVTGCQMAHTTALAAARHKLLRDRGWNVEAKGLAGAPPLRVLTAVNRHESIIRSVRLLGMGTDTIEIVPSDQQGRIDTVELERVLQNAPGVPTIVTLQAGDLNTGTFDPFAEACRIAHDYRAWVHVDGAFGLWVATSKKYRHLLDGAERADSWATDGHKWLNLPFDCGLVFVADPAAHRAAFAQDTTYAVPIEHLRNQKDWNPEWSRRGGDFPAYAAIRALGRSGIADIVDRCCAHADRLATGIGGLPGAEIVVRPTINQGLVRFLSRDGNHDRQTDAVIARIQAICNWTTTDRDVDATIASVRNALADPGT